ncbi:MAG: hypothetical protein CSA25_03815 [Desulfobacter postgatei]|uniref:Uncharacterized protein n=1 Tax=Desulfobacter postgatei TaxID=2293 RepID=A0A2G6MRV3_9BACT|nr:MAG: hypothetical protein CSA25_03815 [Desulfobacter postgatei]
MKMAPIPPNFMRIIPLLTENLEKLVLIFIRFRFDPLITKQALKNLQTVGTLVAYFFLNKKGGQI